MKTPVEIKKGLEVHALDAPCVGSDCPYNGETDTRLCTELIAEDALAYIQQLEATIAEMEKVGLDMAWKLGTLEAQTDADMNIPRWICVEDRLPERHGQMCVGLYNQYGAPKSILFPHVFTWHAYGENGYINGPHFSDEGLDGLKVWYWMPLPEPPKEG